MLISLNAVSALTILSKVSTVSEVLVQYTVASCGSSATMVFPLSQVTEVRANHLHQDFIQ